MELTSSARDNADYGELLEVIRSNIYLKALP